MSSFDDDEPPLCRVTLRDGTVTLNRWRPGMGPFGPLKAGYLSVTAALADLHRAGEGELDVVPVRGVPWSEDATQTLIAWAAHTGYRRLWLPDRVADVEALAEAERARVTCPSCGAVWEDEGTVFWERVRRDGWFPGSCLACGGSLPEWEACGAPCQTGTPPPRHGDISNDAGTAPSGDNLMEREPWTSVFASFPRGTRTRSAATGQMISSFA